MSTNLYPAALVLAVALTVGSCIKEPTTIDTSTLNNATGHTIELQPYRAGILQGDKVITLQPRQNKEIAYGWASGINEAGTGFSSDYLIDMDSLVVTYDHHFRTTHYLAAPAATAASYHLYASTRNLFNIKSYSATVEDKSKYSRWISYAYRFTEEDYGFAK